MNLSKSLTYLARLFCLLGISLALFIGQLGLDAVTAQEPSGKTEPPVETESGGAEVPLPDLKIQAATLTQSAITQTQILGDGDAYVELNEAWQLSLELTNSGDVTATNISAVLTTATPGVRMMSSTSAYSDLIPSSSAANLTPFTFAIDAGATCGAAIDFTLTVTFDGGTSPASFNFGVQSGAPGTPVTTSYTGPAVPIPDGADLSGTAPGAPVNASLPVSAFSGTLFDLDFRFDGATCSTTVGSTTVGLDHTFVNDLEITLRSPASTAVVLINNTDGSGNNFCQTTLDDESAGASIQSVVSAQAPFSGSFRPNAPLAGFDGEDPNGTWQLQAQDFFSADTGNIRAWSITITPALCDAPAEADLTLTKLATPNPVTVGEALTYTLSITNAGPGIASTVVVTDTLPAGLTFDGAIGPDWNCTEAGGIVTCAATTPIISSTAIVITGTAPATAGLITNTATITATTPDPNTADNTAAITTTVIPLSADLVLTKSASPNSVMVGAALTYTLNVANAGPGSASNVVVTDTLPAGLIFGGATGTDWNCTEAGGLVTCAAATPIVSPTAIVITATAPSTPGTITNTATIAATTPDPNPANNTDAIAITVTGVATNLVALPVIIRDILAAPDLIVESLVAGSNAVTVVIKNQGNSPVVDAFWVDVYLNPTTPPTQVNQHWQDLGTQGLVWGIQGAALPLDPGQTLTLSIGDGYYSADGSNFGQPLPVGSPVYAQVDSVNLLTTYGGVLEDHEITGGPYNNISQTESTAASLSSGGQSRPSLSTTGLPPR